MTVTCEEGWGNPNAKNATLGMVDGLTGVQVFGATRNAVEL
jgi:hypothetical protein